MFKKCVKCGTFASRFRLKLTFHSLDYDEKWHDIPEIKELVPWASIKICEKCWRELNDKDMHASQIYFIAKATAETLEEKRQTEELKKIESTINNSFIELYDNMINTIEYLDSQITMNGPEIDTLRSEGREYIEKIKVEKHKLTQDETRRRT